jgi:hypothetical protein
MSLVGFFCTAVCALPAGQLTIDGIPKDRGASLIHRNGVVVGRYIDDNYRGNRRALAARFRREHVGLILVGSYRKQEDFGPGTIDVIEYYPVLDSDDKIAALPRVPPEGTGFGSSDGSGYVLQAFSWGDNLYDGAIMGRCTSRDLPSACARRYSAPTTAQMKRMWCLARQNRAVVVLWYYYSLATAQTIYAIERGSCGPESVRRLQLRHVAPRTHR